MRSPEDKREAETTVHVLILPFPVQGHVNSMLQLAELLTLSDVHVTFLNTEHNHHRLLRFADIDARLARYPTLHFKTFSDGLPADHPRGVHKVGEFIDQVNLHAGFVLRELCSEHSGRPRVSCVIGDGIFGSITNQLGQELGIPIIHFRTISACSMWAYLSVPKLFECNELPIRGEEDMDRIITKIPGMENLVRCRDLPSFCRGKRDSHMNLYSMTVEETQQSLRAQALILNTFEDLEGPVLSHMRLRFPKLYTFGPLHAHLNYRKASKTPSSQDPPPSFSNSLREVDRSCMTWLDAQPPKSVLYVSFGSIAKITRDQLMELWQGLVNSKKRFLWVIRPDMLAEEDEKDLPVELAEGTKERGCMVEWAPQKEVLGHVAVGAFMTHSGWNSTLESVVAGVPMICWPYFADQQINSRFVSEVWKVGLDMKDVCDRMVVERMVNDVMVDQREEFATSAQAMAALADKSVSEGGSSYSDFDSFVEYLKSISVGK